MNTSAATPRAWFSGLILCATLAAGIFGYRLLQARADALDELRQEVSTLRQAQPASETVRELRTVVHERVVPSEPATKLPEVVEPQANAAETTDLTPEELSERTDAIVAAQEAILEDSYDRETADRQWSAGAAAQLRAAYSGEGFEGMNVESDCRATLCRVNFNYAGPEGEQQWRLLRERMPWPGATNANVNFQTRQGTFYIAREGFALPRADATAQNL